VDSRMHPDHPDYAHDAWHRPSGSPVFACASPEAMATRWLDASSMSCMISTRCGHGPTRCPGDLYQLRLRTLAPHRAPGA